MSTPGEHVPTTTPPAASSATSATSASGASASKPSRRGKEPPITGGQRASAILAGLTGHLLFAIGWFGISFVILGPLVSGLVNDLLGNLVGDGDAEQLTSILQRAGALIWLLALVFLVGSLAFIAFGVLTALLILRRGAVDKPGRVNWTSFVIAAIIDIPVFLLVLWLATAVTDGSAGLVWLPSVLALVLAAVIGVVVWWFMAHVNRGKPAPKPAKAGGPGAPATTA